MSHPVPAATLEEIRRLRSPISAGESLIADASAGLPPVREAREDRRGKRLISGHFPLSTWAQLRDIATREGRTQQSLLEEALEDFFAKHPAP